MTAPAELTPLQTRVAREIVALVRREGRRAGDHLPEVVLSERIGTSRSPVQAALRHLASLGVVQQDQNRGFFMSRHADDWSEVAARFSTTPDDPLYLRIALERQTGQLPDEINEAALMRRFDVARSTLRKVLARMSEEGWVERRVGHGWAFLPTIDSAEAYEESYLFRQSIEPTGIVSPQFRCNLAELATLRREQERIVQGGFQSMTAIELFEANSHFHETVALWSRNRFVVQAVRRINQQRRLIEYLQASQRGPRHTQAVEHLDILSAIERQDLLGAAGLMRQHLDDARRNKIKTQNLFADPAPKPRVSRKTKVV